MIDAYRLGVRRALVSVAVGLVGAVAVTATGWALQAAALPPPTPAARVAADASAWFHDYRLVVDVFHFDHRRMKGACLRGWFPRPHGKKARTSLLSLGSRPIVRVSSGSRESVLTGRRGSRRMPGRLAAATGCSGTLASVLAAAAQSGADLTAARGYAANQPAIALKLSHFEDERLTLYVSPRTYRPLVALVAIDGREATARIYLNKVRRRVLARFHLLHEVKLEPRR